MATLHCLQDLADLIVSIKDSVDNKIDSLDNKIDSLQKDMDTKFSTLNDEVRSDLNSLATRVQVTENMCERLDRQAHLSDLIMNGIPATENENLEAIYGNICDTIGFASKTFTLLSIFRVKSKTNKSGSVILKFISANACNNFYHKYLHFKDLTLVHVGFLTESRIYIHESLTSTNAAIYRRALELKKSGILNKAYTNNGFVYCKVKADSPPMQCLQLSQFDKFDNVPVILDNNHKRKPSNNGDNLRSNENRSNAANPRSSVNKIFKSVTASTGRSRSSSTSSDALAVNKNARSNINISMPTTTPPTGKLDAFFTKTIASDKIPSFNSGTESQ